MLLGLSDYPTRELQGLTDRLIAYRFVRNVAQMEFDTRRISKDELTKDLVAADREHEGQERTTSWSGEILKVEWAPKQEATMSVTGAQHAGGSLSAKLKAIRDKIQNGSAKMDAALQKMDQAADAHNSLADTVSSEADALMSEIGQFTNGGPNG